MKVTDSKNINATTGKKKTRKGSAADGASFSSMVEAARAIQHGDALDAPQGVSSFAAGGDAVPSDGRGRSAYLLAQLDTLEQDILGGAPTQALEKLKAALNTDAVDRAELSPEALKLLEELELRASVEVAKLEEQ